MATSDSKATEVTMRLELRPPPWHPTGEAQWVLVVPSQPDDEPAAWDVLAPVLGMRGRLDRHATLSHLDVDGNEFFGTNDVETETVEIDVAVEDEVEPWTLAVAFSVMIDESNEFWRVTLESRDDVQALRSALAAAGSDIAVEWGESTWAAEVSHWRSLCGDRDRTISELLRIMEGFDDAIDHTGWSALPRLPLGWALLRVVRSWLQSEPRGLDDIDRALWLLEGRSRAVFDQLLTRDAGEAERLSAALVSLRSTELPRRASPMPNPRTQEYERLLRRLRSETNWMERGES